MDNNIRMYGDELSSENERLRKITIDLLCCGNCCYYLEDEDRNCPHGQNRNDDHRASYKVCDHWESDELQKNDRNLEIDFHLFIKSKPFQPVRCPWCGHDEAANEGGILYCVLCHKDLKLTRGKN